MTTTAQDNAFGLYTLEWLVEWIRDNIDLDERATEAELEDWADQNGYIHEDKLDNWADDNGYVLPEVTP